MKTIGLIGGITWHSTLDYYRLLNEQVQAKLGGVHSAKIILHSVDFAEIKAPTLREDWDEIANIMCRAAKTLETAGADCLVICANTMHNIAHRVEETISIPLIHIADAAARAIDEKGLKKITLLGTKYTMQMDFYKERLAAQGISVIIPAEPDIEFINHSIYEEFGKGIFLPERKQRYLSIIDSLRQQGAAGVVLGCTEIPILIKQEDCPVPVFDTSYLHALAAVEFAVS
ncbi:MAG TPA: aspartate/glutamate racemase family protein [Chitinophagaceae bacterium]|nr:aspartate/glutamate racemase family protein [Chitinophagaceae bacterium]